MRFLTARCAACDLPATVIIHGTCVVVRVEQALWREKCLHRKSTPGDRMCLDLHTAIADVGSEAKASAQDGLPEMVGYLNDDAAVGTYRPYERH